MNLFALLNLSSPTLGSTTPMPGANGDPCKDADGFPGIINNNNCVAKEEGDPCLLPGNVPGTLDAKANCVAQQGPSEVARHPELRAAISFGLIGAAIGAAVHAKSRAQGAAIGGAGAAAATLILIEGAKISQSVPAQAAVGATAGGVLGYIFGPQSMSSQNKAVGGALIGASIPVATYLALGTN